jgi:2-polyprenyl-3-methyl-5-hydroxy-6-metoxy-1,4-benzoquinol methylase
VSPRQKALAIASLTARLKQIWAKQGGDPEGDQARNLIDYNITTAAHRANELAKFCELAFGLAMSGRDVIDLGCGFGMIGTTLVLDHAARSLQLIDHNPEFLDAAAAMVAEAGLAQVKVIRSSLDDFDIPEEAADVILMIDLFHVRSFDHPVVLSRCRQALRRGGVMLVRTTNRVTAIDQATMVEGPNMLAARWADPFVRWRSGGTLTYDDRAARVPADVATSLEGAGFANLRILMTDGYHLAERFSHRSAVFSPFCYLGAQRPA